MSYAGARPSADGPETEDGARSGVTGTGAAAFTMQRRPKREDEDEAKSGDQGSQDCDHERGRCRCKTDGPLRTQFRANASGQVRIERQECTA